MLDGVRDAEIREVPRQVLIQDVDLRRAAGGQDRADGCQPSGLPTLPHLEGFDTPPEVTSRRQDQRLSIGQDIDSTLQSPGANPVVLAKEYVGGQGFTHATGKRLSYDRPDSGMKSLPQTDDAFVEVRRHRSPDPSCLVS
jgi:hypothetical protein